MHPHKICHYFIKISYFSIYHTLLFLSMWIMCSHIATSILFSVGVYTTKNQCECASVCYNIVNFRNGSSHIFFQVDHYLEKVKHVWWKTHFSIISFVLQSRRNADVLLLTFRPWKMNICTPTRALVGVHETVEFHILRVGTGKTENSDVFKILKHSHFHVMHVYNRLL